jgi:Protein of unknown function (DUF2851)
MNEAILQHIWKFKRFDALQLQCTKGFPIQILDFGHLNKDAGPDFYLGKIKYQDHVWAGNIELHVNSADWYAHRHQFQANYHQIILHVVYQNDKLIAELEALNIPCLELKSYIPQSVIDTYQQLNNSNTQFIPCEGLIEPQHLPFAFAEETLLKKLDHKANEIQSLLQQHQQNYNAVLASKMAYAFGLKINADIFQMIFESVEFGVWQKIQHSLPQTEALLMGISGWLHDPKDEQSQIWQREYHFLKAKYGLNLEFQPKFSKLRPPNFPSLRWSQFANLWHREAHLFSKIIEAKDLNGLKALFLDISASPYWDGHFSMGITAKNSSQKTLTHDFIDLLLINTILPLRYAYQKQHQEDAADEILSFYQSLKAEKNGVVEAWQKLGFNLKTALDSQAYLSHHSHFCQAKKCLDCGFAIGFLKQRNA